MESQHIYQTDKQFSLKFEDEKIKLPLAIQKLVEDDWHEKLCNQPTLTNGPIYSIHKIKKTNVAELTITVRKTDYAHYLYSKEQKLEQQYVCRSIAANCLMLTKDDYLVLGMMNQQTSMPGKVKFIGGAFSEADIKNGVFDANHCIEREVFEELGVLLSSIQTQEQVQEFILTREKFSFMNILQIRHIRLSKDELKQSFHHFQEMNPSEQELSNICLIKNNHEEVSRFLEEKQHVLIDYMQEFFLVYRQVLQPGKMIETL